jgi:TRAP-type C4-dicarboxylate transport system permease small subunit
MELEILMSLRKAIEFIGKILSPVMPVFSNIGAYIIIVMMLLTVVDVVGRRFFNKPVPGSYELSEFMLVIVVFLAIAYCEFTRGHVTIDLVVSRFRKRTQNIINSTMYILTLVAFVLLTWRLFVDAAGQVGGTISGILRIPVFPFIYIAALGCAFLSLVVLMHLLQFILEALRK